MKQGHVKLADRSWKLAMLRGSLGMPAFSEWVRCLPMPESCRRCGHCGEPCSSGLTMPRYFTIFIVGISSPLGYRGTVWQPFIRFLRLGCRCTRLDICPDAILRECVRLQWLWEHGFGLEGSNEEESHDPPLDAATLILIRLIVLLAILLVRARGPVQQQVCLSRRAVGGC